MRKTIRKVLSLLLASAVTLSMAACGSTGGDTATTTTAKDTDTTTTAGGTTAEGETTTGNTDGAAFESKIGVILVHDENTGYDFAHIEGIKKAAAAVGISEDNIIFKYNISEDETCYDTATDLVEQGCTYIFSDSYGHQSYMKQAAEENPTVVFTSMTGDMAAASGLKNYKNAFNHTYQSRYVSGVVAGMKLAELVAADKVPAGSIDSDGNIKIGYVGAYPYAEVVSGYTAFYLGVKSVVKNVAMSVTYTNSWYDPTSEAEAANSLISSGCIILSQHADSTGAPAAVQAAFEAGTTAYCVGYNIDMLTVAPDAALTSAQNDWSVFYTYAFTQILAGKELATDWAEGYNSGAVHISALGKSCAEGTADKVAEVEGKLKDGSLQVFDTANFTVGGKAVTSYLAIDKDGDFKGDEGEAIEGGIFYESKLRSAPYFGLRIDGITELN